MFFTLKEVRNLLQNPCGFQNTVLKLHTYLCFYNLGFETFKNVLQTHILEINIYSQVRAKASSQEECLQELEELLKTRYSGQSGIIYTTSIKDCEQLMHGLRNRQLHVGCYHANLDAKLRSKVHTKWLSGKYQVGSHYCCMRPSCFCHVLYRRCHKWSMSLSGDFVPDW